MNTQAPKNNETIKMVERALQVLDLLRAPNSRFGVNEIAKKCDLNPSTTFRILKTLEKSGWVFQLSDDRYISGEKLSFITEKNNLYLALQDVALFIMQDYTDQYGQAMNLMVRNGKHCVIIQQSRTNRFVDYVPPMHTDLPIHACAGGKILLSSLPINYAERIINACELTKLTEDTITDTERFWQELRQTATQGYAFDHKESTENGSCIAVPVYDREGTVIAAISFSGFIGVEDTDDLLKYLPILHEVSNKISHSLFRVGTEYSA